MNVNRIADAAIEESVRRHIDKLFDVYFTATDDKAIERLINGIKLTAEKYETAQAALLETDEL